MNTMIIEITTLLSQISKSISLISKLKASENSVIYLTNYFSETQMINKNSNQLEHKACLMIKDYLSKIFIVLDKKGSKINSRGRALIRLNLKKISVLVEMIESSIKSKKINSQVIDKRKETDIENVSELIKSQKDVISKENSNYIQMSQNLFGCIQLFHSAKKSAWNEMNLILQIIRCSYDNKKRNHLLNKYTLNMDLNSIKTINNMKDTKLLKCISSYPPIEHNTQIFVPRTVEELTRASILSNSYHLKVQDEKATFFTSQNQEDSLVPLRFLSSSNPSKFVGSLRPETLVIYLHGGGYFSKTSHSCQPYTRKWSNELNLPIFCIDYRLAPENRFPKSLDDVWQAYVWLVNNSQSQFGVIAKKIIVVGSSAGANFGINLAFLCEQTGFRRPDGLMLAYPCLNLDSKRLSETNLASLEDPIISFKFIEIMRMAYLEDENDLDHFMVSPLNCPDYILENFPNVRMIVGLDDCLNFDSLEFAERLLRINGRVKILKYEGFLHGAFNMANDKSTRSYERILDDTIKLIRELIS